MVAKGLAIFPKLVALFLKFKLKNKTIQFFQISFCLAIFPKLVAFFLEFKLKDKTIQFFPISFCLAIFPKLVAFFLKFKLKDKTIQIFPISFCLASGEILPQKNHWQGKAIQLVFTRVRAYMR